MPTEKNAAFLPTQYSFKLDRQRVKRINTTPYYPQASLAERVMRSLKAALKIFHNQSQKMWDDKLHFLAFAFNSACHESTKMCLSCFWEES